MKDRELGERESESCLGGGVSRSDGSSAGSAHRERGLRVGMNAGALAEKVGVEGSFRCGGVGEGTGAGSAQSSLAGVTYETGTETGSGVAFRCRR